MEANNQTSKKDFLKPTLLFFGVLLLAGFAVIFGWIAGIIWLIFFRKKLNDNPKKQTLVTIVVSILSILSFIFMILSFVTHKPLKSITISSDATNQELEVGQDYIINIKCDPENTILSTPMYCIDNSCATFTKCTTDGRKAILHTVSEGTVNISVSSKNISSNSLKFITSNDSLNTKENGENVSSETDLEIVTRVGHPTYYGSVAASHTIWDDVKKEKILFGDDIGSFGDETILSMSAYRNSDLIRGVCISFSNFEIPVTFTIEDVLPIIASYMPYDIMDKYYQYSESKSLVPNSNNTSTYDKYYIITYLLNDDGKKAYSEGAKEYSGSIDVIINADENEIVDSFSIGFGTPRWMQSSNLNKNDYHQEFWDCDLYNFKTE